MQSANTRGVYRLQVLACGWAVLVWAFQKYQVQHLGQGSGRPHLPGWVTQGTSVLSPWDSGRTLLMSMHSSVVLEERPALYSKEMPGGVFRELSEYGQGELGEASGSLSARDPLLCGCVTLGKSLGHRHGNSVLKGPLAITVSSSHSGDGRLAAQGEEDTISQWYRRELKPVGFAFQLAECSWLNWLTSVPQFAHL